MDGVRFDPRGAGLPDSFPGRSGAPAGRRRAEGRRGPWWCSWRSRVSLDRADGDADDAVPVGGFDGAVGDEAVGAVDADALDGQAGALDRGDVLVHRDGAGDAGGPELRVAARALLQRP